MKSSFLFTLLMVICTSHICAQQGHDSIPAIYHKACTWNEVDAKMGNFNKKDGVMMIIRQNGLAEVFSQEKDFKYLDYFHYTDVDGDSLPDVIFTGSLFYHLGSVTYIFLYREAQMKYEKVFMGAGIITQWKTSLEKLDLTLYQPAYGAHYQYAVKDYSIHFKDNSQQLNWQIVYLDDRIPEPRVSPGFPVTVAKATYLRSMPELKDDPMIDLDQDGEMDAQGNRVAAFNVSAPAKIIGEDRTQPDWVFVLLDASTAHNHVLMDIAGKRSYAAGWMLKEDLK